MRVNWIKLNAVVVLLIMTVCFPIRTLLADEAQIKKLYIELILDASNSMNELLDGRKRIDIAKQSLNEVLGDIASDTYLALRIYGSDINRLQIKPGQSKKDAQKSACMDSVLKVGFGIGNVGKVTQAINAATATGYTPLAYSLELAGGDFVGIDGNNYIILASDGQETCGGDPVTVVNGLKAKGINVIIHTIGFAVDDETRKQLEDIAKAGGGNYYSADNAEELKGSFKKVIKKIREIKGEEDDLFEGQEITPGSSYESAPLLGPGKYKLLNLAIAQDINHVVKIDLKTGQILKGVATYTGIPGDKTRQGYDSRAYIHLYDDENRKAFSKDGRFSVEKTRTFDYQLVSEKNGEYFMVFNTMLSSPNKDYEIQGFSIGLTIEIEDRSDIGSGVDASDKFKEAMPIKPGNYEENWIAFRGDNDKYTMELEAGQTIKVKMFPSEKYGAELRIYNEDREEVSADASKNYGAVAKVEYTSADGEEIYIDVKRWSGDDTGSYEMKIKVKGGEATLQGE